MQIIKGKLATVKSDKDAAQLAPLDPTVDPTFKIPRHIKNPADLVARINAIKTRLKPHRRDTQ